MPTSELDMFTEESQSRQGSGAGKRRESGRVGASPDAAGERSPALPDLLPVEELVPLPTEFPPSTLEGVLAAVDGSVAVGEHRLLGFYRGLEERATVRDGADYAEFGRSGGTGLLEGLVAEVAGSASGDFVDATDEVASLHPIYPIPTCFWSSVSNGASACSRKSFRWSARLLACSET